MSQLPSIRPTSRQPRSREAWLVCVWMICAVAGPATALDDWRTVAPDGDAFRLEMPAEPSTERKERWFPVSDFVSTVYTARVGDDAFGLNHTDLPRVALWFAPRSRIFQSAREGFLEDSNATELSYDETEFEGRPARELLYDIPASAERPPLRGRARMFFEKNRLYIIWAEVTDRIEPDDLERYFDSLRVGKPDA